MDLKTQDSGASVTLSESAFGSRFNSALVHQAVTAYLSGGRAGTKGQKNRSAVAGGGAKPWRQKGTGRARAGTSSSPLWRSGGVTFAAQPRNYEQKLNRKMYRAAMRSIFSELVRQDRLLVVDAIEVAEPKTRLLAERLKAMEVGSTLIVDVEVSRELALAARNLPNVDVVSSTEVNPVNLMRHDKVIATVDAVRKIEGWLS
ncbi:MAG: 50S ribosomal protein L4 [Gammaproteobacteria bacterium]|jgi:large subunit ribosomal protein L4|nr:50S ribosomal protein L4 [Gammaproteobacteria bacterium]